jgi:hypothetical protein
MWNCDLYESEEFAAVIIEVLKSNQSSNESYQVI